MKILILLLLSTNIFSADLKIELLNKINENLLSAYTIEFSDVKNCTLKLTSKSTGVITSWDFNLLDMEFSFDANDFVFLCGDFNFCIDKTTEFLDRDRDISRYSQTYYLSSNNMMRSELMPIFDELVDLCTPPTEEEIKEKNHNEALAENARRGWGQTSVH